MKVARRGNHRGQLIKAAAWGAGKLVRHVAKRVGSGPAKRSEPGGKGKKSNDDGVMTNQYDTNLTYRRKKGRKRRKATFSQKVKRAIEYNYGDQELARQYLVSTTTTAGITGLMCFSIYGNGLRGGFADDDLPEMFSGYEAATTPAGAHLFTKSARVDMMLTNTGSNTAKVSVYEVFPKRDFGGYSATGLVASDWTVLSSNTYTPPLAGTAFLEGAVTNYVSSSLPQNTPFNCSAFCSKYTIVNKRDFILSAGQVGTLSVSHNIKKKIAFAQIQDQDETYYKSWTKCVLVVVHGVPSAGTVVTTTATAYPTATVALCALKTYRFAVIRDEYTRGGLSNNTT